MYTVLLNANRRILILAAAPLLLIGAAAVSMIYYGGVTPPDEGPRIWLLIGGAILTIVFLLFMITLILFVWRPRIAYREGHLIIYATATFPIRVPLDVVECFFLGQSDTNFQNEKLKNSKTQAVVVRLAEKEKDWAEREIIPLLGRWCDSYITLRGTWTEPLCSRVINRMNHTLAEIKKQRKAEATKEIQ